MAEFSTDKRKELSQKGQAMPDGGYPIRNAADLQNAIQAFGRANNKPAVKAWIKKRAKELGLEKMLPVSWNSMSQSERGADHVWITGDNSENSLSHHGIMGMKWGHHRAVSLSGKIANEHKTGREDVQEWKEIGGKNVNKNIAKSHQITRNNVKKLTAQKDKIQGNMDAHATKRTQDAVAKLSKGQTLGRSLLLGSYGALVYTGLKAKGVSTGKAAAQAITNNWANNITLGHLSRTSKW